MKEAIDFIILIIIYFTAFLKKWKDKGKKILLVNTLMYIYLSFVLYFTLMPIFTSIPHMFNHPYNPMNMNAFIDVYARRSDSIRQIGLNVIMTIPFGILCPLTKNTKLAKTLAYTFLLSLTIELLQPLISTRLADITDIIANVLGGLIGYIIYIIFKPLINKILVFLCK